VRRPRAQYAVDGLRGRIKQVLELAGRRLLALSMERGQHTKERSQAEDSSESPANVLSERAPKGLIVGEASMELVRVERHDRAERNARADRYPQQ